MSNPPQSRLQTTYWLADRLDISITTIERLRSEDPASLPPHVHIGRSIKYDERTVEDWLRNRMGLTPTAPAETDAG